MPACFRHRKDSQGRATVEYLLLMAAEAHDVTRALLVNNPPDYSEARAREAEAWKHLIKAAEAFLATVPVNFRTK